MTKSLFNYYINFGTEVHYYFCALSFSKAFVYHKIQQSWVQVEFSWRADYMVLFKQGMHNALPYNQMELREDSAVEFLVCVLQPTFPFDAERATSI